VTLVPTVWTDRREAAMMHVRTSLITAAPPVLAGCLADLEGKVRPVVESQPGSLGLPRSEVIDLPVNPASSRCPATRRW
jgi:hypothetical protein